MSTHRILSLHRLPVRGYLPWNYQRAPVSSLAADLSLNLRHPSAIVPPQSNASNNEEVASVALVGATNAGKSTLMNRLIGARIAAVSRKVNTTRRRIIGVHTSQSKQLIFWDTPGVVERKFQSTLGRDRREISSAGWGAAVEADVAVMVVDASRKKGHLEIVAKLLTQLTEFRRVSAQNQGLSGTPATLVVLNKCDIVRPRSRLLDMTLSLKEQVPNFEDVVTEATFLCSAYNGAGVSLLRDSLLSHTQPSPFEVDANAFTDEPDVDILEQQVWEKMLHRLHQEVPYQCRLQIEDWKELPDGSAAVSAVIRVPKKRHVPMVVGPRGDIVRWIAEKSSESTTAALRRNIYLRLRVATGGPDV